MLNDYTTITAKGVEDVTESAIARANELIDSVAATVDPSWDTVMAPLEKASAIVGDAYGAGPFMARVHPDKDVVAKAIEMEERMQKWTTDIVFRRDLYETVKTLAESDSSQDAVEQRLIEHWMRDFRRAGHELPEAAREELKEKQKRLIELQVAFSRNLDEFEDSIEVTTEQLEGVSQDYISRLAKGDQDGTYRITMAYPDYVPFMEQGRDRSLRRALQHKFWNQASSQNRPLLEQAVAIRQDIAALLGYDTWAHYAMEPKMAAAPSNVEEFYASLVDRLQARAREELTAMRPVMEANYPGEEIKTWDWSYLDTLQRKNDYGVDPDEVASYFSLEPLIEGMFDVTGDVLGLDYERVEDTKAWHPDVYLYAIKNRGEDEPIAYFYADLFPREGKYGHAAAFAIQYGREESGEYVKPVAAIVANFTKPTAESPSLLQHGEAVTLWHEFGHILHFCLTTVNLVRFSGYDTEWDFVEAPSQIMENWMWEPEVLQRFARHHETSEPIPNDLVDKLVAARDLNVGLRTLRQMFLGRLDLDMHSSAGPVDIEEIYRASHELTQLPFHEETFFPAVFGHLMGGYDAGYYGYLWAQVYGDDMFSVFESQGITSPEVGRRYRDEVLATGGSRDAIDHLRAFLGREPSSEAFLAKLGLD
ncbi:MAG: Zn-dependent oligopeptidase [Acidimicrobiia bacterium]|nr:Zn-dependent oligopeptidase [Acidimicrobiia bacterium]